MSSESSSSPSSHSNLNFTIEDGETLIITDVDGKVITDYVFDASFEEKREKAAQHAIRREWELARDAYTELWHYATFWRTQQARNIEKAKEIDIKKMWTMAAAAIVEFYIGCIEESHYCWSVLFGGTLRGAEYGVDYLDISIGNPLFHLYMGRNLIKMKGRKVAINNELARALMGGGPQIFNDGQHDGTKLQPEWDIITKAMKPPKSHQSWDTVSGTHTELFSLGLCATLDSLNTCGDPFMLHIIQQKYGQLPPFVLPPDNEDDGDEEDGEGGIQWVEGADQDDEEEPDQEDSKQT